MTTIIGYDNKILTGTLSVGSEESDRPGSNIALAQGEPPWQTANGVLTSANGAWIQVDAGSSITWRVFSLHRTNLTTSASVRYMLGTSAGASDVYDQTDTNAVAANYNQAVHLADQDYTARYLRIEIEDSANPDNNIQVGLAFAGPVFIPTIPADRGGANEQRRPNESVTKTRGGQEYVITRYSQRLLTIPLNFLSTSEVYDEVSSIQSTLTSGENILAIPFNTASLLHKTAVFGRVPSIGNVGWNQGLFRKQTITIHERV